MTRNRINIILISIILFVIVLGGAFLNNRLSITPKAIIETKRNVSEDSIIRIGILGDSWAYNSVIFNFPYYIDSLLNNKQIKSYTSLIKGLPGAKSKDIYIWLKKNILDDPLKGYKYCILFCGLNDLHGQYGNNYYSQHTMYIIDYLLKHKVKPIIFEIPFTYHLNQYKTYPLWKRYAYTILSLITSKNVDLDNLYNYRYAIEKTIDKINNDSIIYIKTDKYIDGTQNLYLDNIHINDRGYEYLGTIIFQTILKDTHENSY